MVNHYFSYLHAMREVHFKCTHYTFKQNLRPTEVYLEAIETSVMKF